MTSSVATEPVRRVTIRLVAGLDLYGPMEAQALCWIVTVIVALGLTNLIAGAVLIVMGVIH